MLCILGKLLFIPKKKSKFLVYKAWFSGISALACLSAISLCLAVWWLSNSYSMCPHPFCFKICFNSAIVSIAESAFWHSLVVLLEIKFTILEPSLRQQGMALPFESKSLYYTFQEKQIMHPHHSPNR